MVKKKAGSKNKIKSAKTGKRQVEVKEFGRRIKTFNAESVRLIMGDSAVPPSSTDIQPGPAVTPAENQPITTEPDGQEGDYCSTTPSWCVNVEPDGDTYYACMSVCNSSSPELDFALGMQCDTEDGAYAMAEKMTLSMEILTGKKSGRG